MSLAKQLLDYYFEKGTLDCIALETDETESEQKKKKWQTTQRRSASGAG